MFLCAIVGLCGFAAGCALGWRLTRPRREPRLQATFRDTAGRLWTVRVRVAELRRIKSLCNVDLLELVQPQKPEQLGLLIGRLLSDPVLLVDVLYCVLQEDCEKRGISDIDFGRSLGGDVLAEAVEALIAGLIDFFPHRRDRWRMRRIAAAVWKMANRAETLLDRTMTPASIQNLLGEPKASGT